MNKNLKFEDAMKRLEEIVEQMEKGDINLDKSLAYFEEGIKLVRFCSSKLEEVKKMDGVYRHHIFLYIIQKDLSLYLYVFLISRNKYIQQNISLILFAMEC